MIASFSVESVYPLADTLRGCVGEVCAIEERDAEAWLVIDFTGYGTVILPAIEFDII